MRFRCHQSRLISFLPFQFLQQLKRADITNLLFSLFLKDHHTVASVAGPFMILISSLPKTELVAYRQLK